MCFLIKVGKKQYLEQLKQGIVHFSTLETFQNDPTSFRGDKMEGRYYYDTRQPFIVNEVNFSPYIDELTFSRMPDCTLLSFSSSIISKTNCTMGEDRLYKLKKEFISEMSQFGDSFLIIDAFEFIDSFLELRCDYEYHPITYIDKHDYQKISDHYMNLPDKEKEYCHFFVKDSSYSLQNEWRLILLDTKQQFTVDKNGGVNIQMSFSSQMPIFSTSDLYSLQLSEEFLYE